MASNIRCIDAHHVDGFERFGNTLSLANEYSFIDQDSEHRVGDTPLGAHDSSERNGERALS